LKEDLKIIKMIGAKKAMRRAWCVYNLSEFEHSIFIAVWELFVCDEWGKQFADVEKIEGGRGEKGEAQRYKKLT
jgi:hypothetical protein